MPLPGKLPELPVLDLGVYGMTPVAAYDAIAEWYDDQVRSGGLLHDLVLPEILALIGDVNELPLCDLACGQGVVARHLVRRGAVVTGIDVSIRLLGIAQNDERADPSGIRYLQGDAQQLVGIADASFAGVVCHMALMDIPDLAATLRTVARILRPDGWFVFAITHPVLDAALERIEIVHKGDGSTYRQVRGYFREGPWRGENPNGVRGKVDTYHRTLSTYVNTILAAGLLVEQMVEPRATGRLAERVPHLQRVPGVLIVRCKKVTA